MPFNTPRSIGRALARGVILSSIASLLITAAPSQAVAQGIDPMLTQGPGTAIPLDPTNQPDYPSTLFPVTGEADVSVMRNMKTEVASWLLSSGGLRRDLTDRLSFRFTVTMVSTRPVVSWNCTYNPETETFPYLDYDTHIQMFIIVNGVEIDAENSDGFRCNGGGSMQSTNTFNAANQDLEVGIRVWTQNLDEFYQTVGVKTATAHCDPTEGGQSPAQGTICRFDDPDDE
ncbi:hypothetical protein [Rhodococcoides fascians]|uniref:hypothetical protein n=1 Tax=Rhodococcoides fascians TaxID=1828 RepID=UPI00117997BE|nr:hypothetical protein [Rhodococcus fascians]